MAAFPGHSKPLVQVPEQASIQRCPGTYRWASWGHQALAVTASDMSKGKSGPREMAALRREREKRELVETARDWLETEKRVRKTWATLCRRARELWGTTALEKRSGCKARVELAVDRLHPDFHPDSSFALDFVHLRKTVPGDHRHPTPRQQTKDAGLENHLHSVETRNHPNSALIVDHLRSAENQNHLRFVEAGTRPDFDPDCHSEEMPAEIEDHHPSAEDQNRLRFV
eukprot:RCo055701